MSKLAILGGEPTRKVPFHSSVVIDDREREIINEVLDKGEFSRFMGSPAHDIEKQLVMTSLEAVDYRGQYFTFLGGGMVRRFEADFSRKFGVPYTISVNSATSGLSVALGAGGIGPGDEVITTCMSFNATAISILVFNSIPVFVDVLPKTYCLDPEKVRAAVTHKTKAILVVHLLGFQAEMDEIMSIAEEYDLLVIEDCAQAPGTKYKGQYVGTIGHLGVFSFQETKNITTGEGGMIITRDPRLAKKCRLIRNHGESIPDDNWQDEDLVNIIGMNFRMTELTAALGVAQLEKLDENNRARKHNADYLIQSLGDIDGLDVPGFTEGAVPHVLPLIYDETTTGIHRDIILRALRAEGIPVGGGYLRLMQENPIFQRKVAYGRAHCPWSCPHYGEDRAYDNAECPVADELLRKRFIWFYHINRPNDLDDMRDVDAAFHKVFTNLEALKGYDPSDSKLSYKW